MQEQLLVPTEVASRRVLVIDDDRDFADSLCNLLAFEGYHVEPAYSLAGAMETLERFAAEVALIDIRMGDQNGLTLVPQFKQRRPEITCVIMTAYASAESAIQALQDGAYDFLCKPFYPEDLIATLERCFERIALARSREEAEAALRLRNEELEALNARLKRVVAGMQLLSSSSTLQALYRTALEELAHNLRASNVGLYLIKGGALILHRALAPGLPARMPLPDDPAVFAASSLALPPAMHGAQMQARLWAFPLTADRQEPLGLWALALDRDGAPSEQDQEFGLILASFTSEAVRLLEALDDVRWSEARLREIIDNSPSLISLSDLEGRFLVVNRQFEAWHGRRADEAAGKTASDLFSPDIARLYQSESAAVADGGSVIEEEIEAVFRDGTAHAVLVTRFPVRDADGRPIGVGTIATDVTDRRRVEERLRQAQKMEALGQLTGGIAHDFNNLLAVIIGNLDLLRDELGEEAATRELVDDSLSSARCGTELVHRLLAFGRRQRLNPEPTDANRIVMRLSRVLERTLGGTIEIRQALSPELRPIDVDRSQLETSLLNLALNARDAMRTGGVITVETKNITVDRQSMRSQESGDEIVASGAYIMLAVTDTGAGMTPAVAERAVQPFFTTKQAGQGNGLGLSMVYGFVKQSGGYVEIDSRPGEGTSVRLFLPASAATL